MPDQWSHVRWIGGSSCAGKSTIAQQLAAQYYMNLYECDSHWIEHTQIDSLPTGGLLKQLGNMSWEEIFMRPVDIQVETEIAVYQEEFRFILDDLAKFPINKLLLVEGAALQPALVTPLLINPEHAIWIVPTEKFQRNTYPTRKWMHDIADQTSNPTQAINNWMSRDAQYARWIEEQVEHFQQEIIIVDGTHSIEHNADIIRKRFDLTIDLA